MSLNSLDILTALIDDTIAFSECENGKIVIKIVKSDLKEEIVKLSKMFEFDSKQKEIEFEIKMELKRRLFMIDIKKMHQILIILLSNSFKYTIKGKIGSHAER